MKNTKSLGGKEITREQALEGLGNPEDWDKEKEEFYKEFRKKPKNKNKNQGIISQCKCHTKKPCPIHSKKY